MDFTNIIKENPSYRAYGGANGIKKGILLENEPYMLKIEHRDKKNNRYKNSVFSEYIGSKIYSILGIPVQEVILGKLYDNEKEKLCVACKDFKEKGEYLYEFINIKNSILNENSSNGSGTELKEILEAIDEQNFCNPIEVKQRFWEMFIVDSYLGNFDRHNGNWGFLVNEITGNKRIAPIYDCGSCLFPMAEDEKLKIFLNSKEEMEMRVFKFPNSAIKENEKKINYFEFLISTTNEECLNSLKKIVPKIKEKTEIIENFIDSIEELSEIRKKFYKKILNMRKELILEPALERAKNMEKINQKRKIVKKLKEEELEL
ncbi:HipA domain-containing protein [uncultured Fusobacterium sp.]|uniref:HipA domain-containing protein n=1 Tax=uncultured Fusobacterium sp. TaxID=159267 RepID=UPI0015A5FD05|nr:HipA domain-containing protein [uncultured Fusobacterium sp.]